MEIKWQTPSSNLHLLSSTKLSDSNTTFLAYATSWEDLCQSETLHSKYMCRPMTCTLSDICSRSWHTYDGEQAHEVWDANTQVNMFKLALQLVPLDCKTATQTDNSRAWAHYPYKTNIHKGPTTTFPANRNVFFVMNNVLTNPYFIGTVFQVSRDGLAEC